MDGEWKVSAELDVFKDDVGNENHIITVPKSTNCAITRVLASDE